MAEPLSKPTKPPKSSPPVNTTVDSEDDNQTPDSPATRRKKISVGIPIHPPEGEITNLIVNKRVAEVKGG